MTDTLTPRMQLQRFGLSLPPQMYARIIEESVKLGVSRSSVVKLALDEHFSRKDAER